MVKFSRFELKFKCDEEKNNNSKSKRKETFGKQEEFVYPEVVAAGTIFEYKIITFEERKKQLYPLQEDCIQQK